MKLPELPELLSIAESAGATTAVIANGRHDGICFTALELQKFVCMLFDGKVLVPIEPTQKMLDAELGLRYWDDKPSYEHRRDLRPVIWKAMLSAAKE